MIKKLVIAVVIGFGALLATALPGALSMKKKAETGDRIRVFKIAIDQYYISGALELSAPDNATVVRQFIQRGILNVPKNQMNSKGEWLDGWGTPFRIHVVAGRGHIESAGPDKRFETEDDLKTGRIEIPTR